MAHLCELVIIGIFFLTFTATLNPNYLLSDRQLSTNQSEDTSSTTIQYETTTIDEKELCDEETDESTPQYETENQFEDEEVPTLQDEDYIPGCACGIQKSRSSRVIGGADARRNEFPWFVVIALNNGREHDSFYCGGAIINDRTVLTTASCVFKPTVKYYIRLNVYDRDDAQGVNRTIKRILKHPKFSRCTGDNDIALIELEEPIIELEDNIRPVCLPTYSPQQTKEQKLKNKDLLTVVGFGTTTVGNYTKPERLQKLDLPYLSPKKCNRTGNRGHFTDNMICAGFTKGGKDTCTGDGGGPLTRLENGIAIQHGINSFGNGCALRGFVGLYTKVANYIPWIIRNSHGAKWCRKVDSTVRTDINKIIPVFDDPVINSLFGNYL